LWAAPEGHFLAPLCGFRPRGLSAKTYNTFLPMSAASMYRHLNLGLRRHALVVAVAWLGMSCPISLSSLHAQAAPAVDPRVTEAGAIEGTLFPPPDSHGKSAEGIKVTIDETGQSVDTDKHGKYSFENVKPGTYTLIASGSGYSRLRITDVVVKPNRTLTLNSEVMPMVMKDGEVQVMAEVVVNANKEIQTLEKLVVTDSNPAPFTDNFDLPRTKDDIQPYYMWDSTQIENSGATNLMDFFATMVPMDTAKGTVSQSGNSVNAYSNFSLNGLSSNSNLAAGGTQNTLILVNGLPLPSYGWAGSTYQPNLNGIPLAAIDHVEVLTSSAAAIYGPNATGGVINIVLKANYSGGELSWTYNNTFSSDAPIRNISLTFGESLEGGKTHFLFTASYQTDKGLRLQDRTQILGPYSSKFFSGYPGGELAYLGLTTSTGAIPTTAATVILNTPVVRSVNGTPLIPGSTATQLQIPAGYMAGSGLAPLQANLGNYNLSRPNDAVANGIDGALYPLLQGPQDKAMGFSISRQMTRWLELFTNYSYNSVLNIAQASYNYVSGITVPANAPGNPFGQAVTVSSGNVGPTQPVTYTNNINRVLSFGAKITLPDNWKGELDYTWGLSNVFVYENLTELDTTSLQNAVTAGAVNVLQDLSIYHIPNFSEYSSDSQPTSLNTLQFRASGPLPKLWAVIPTLSIGAGSQQDGSGSGNEYISYPERATYGAATSAVTTYLYFPGQQERHESGYAELELPLVSKANAIPAVRGLLLQAVGRYDSFQEFTTSPVDTVTNTLVNGTTTTSPNLLNGQPEPLTANPTTKYGKSTGTVGFEYHPVDDMFFRWSFSTGYDVPSFNQLIAPISQGTQVEPTTPAAEVNPGVPTTSPWSYSAVTDPVSNTTYFVPVETGGNSNLKPETSHGIDWGVVFEPKFVRGLRIAVDYTKVTKYNDIITPTTATLIQYSAQFPGRVQRSSPTGPIVFINDTAINAPETYTSAYNIEIDYSWKTASLGDWKLTGIANSWQHYDIQSVIGGPFVEQLGNPNLNAFGGGAGLAKFKGNLGLDWSKGSFFAGWMAQYVGPYTEGSEYGLGGSLSYEVQTVNGWVSGQIYHDVYVGYRTGKAGPAARLWGRALAGITVRLGVNNVFDKIPPYDGSTGLSQLYSSYGDARLATYILSVKKDF